MSTLQWPNIRRIDSPEGNVAKFVYTKAGEKPAVVESVLYKYQTYQKRTVICCSTQSGCPVACRFCGAGDYFVRSLSEDEIVDQPQYLLESQIDGVRVADIERIQIMFMSMGEPMLNQANLIPALYRLNKMYPNAALLISTSGPSVDYSKFTEVSKQISKIGLQFSVHESEDEARNKLIPFKNKMTLQEISETGTEWAKATGRQAFFNYCAHDKNDKDEDADRIRRLFSPQFWQATISVICERDETVAQSHKRQEELAFNFEQKLLARGFSTRMFNPGAQDSIGGGCGQLWFVQDWFKQNPTLAKPSIGHGLPIVHMPN